MTNYIVLLRGINVSGQRKIKMSQLRAMLEALGFSEVSTYIQSGNIVLKSALPMSTEVAQIIKEGIYKTFGFDVHVLAKTMPELEEIIQRSPFRTLDESESKKWYYVLLQETPKTELINSLQQEKFPNEQFTIATNCVYLSCDQGYGKTKCDTNFFENKLKVSATTRNHRTMMKLLEMGKQISKQ
ncbi:DUF1697 domain-containing protein [Arenibacter troitsensis]|uniref:Uncharacterized conserved protein, DUF1697 family n=1 Tax=Arenibacter troitsensis TaxID=188872 RepID=A0A1X7JRI8_9FLAO|nr:DUF1697 domain-containing protein [Arenibacter troitsensis]SMG30602.1 Uncharacterized conserved protein, DUF1697 family [Arenibacter troitsensis]